MKYFYLIIFFCILPACTTMQGVPLGNGQYKFISGGESKQEAFSEIIRVMKATCEEENYKVIEQVVEGNGQIVSREIKSDKDSFSLDGFSLSNTTTEYENFRGYDITTVFRCSNEHNKSLKQDK